MESICMLEYVEGASGRRRTIELASPPRDARSITRLPGLSWKNFLRSLKDGELKQICLVSDADSASPEVNAVSVDRSSRPKSTEPKTAREERFAAQTWEALRESGNPVYETAREYADVFPDKIPAELPADRGIRHEIDLVPGSKYCVTRQWPLPRDQVKAIDEFFENRRKAGHVRESTSPHSSPTFCVKKATGGWRIVHAFNKLNDATIPAQTPIPRKDMVLDAMSGSEIFSAIDLTDGFYQILMRLSDIPFTALSTPSGMLWDWLVGYALMQFDDEGHERVVSYQSRQLKPAERNYLVHDKELLAMRYALIKFRVYLLGEKTFAVYTDHASLRTAMKSPHLSQRMARWLLFFSEYNFVVHCKPGKNNILADALSRRPNYDPRDLLGRQASIEDDDEDNSATCQASGLNLTSVSSAMPLRDEIRAAYENDTTYSTIMEHLRSPSDDTLRALTRSTRHHIDRYRIADNLLTYSIDHFDAPRIVVPNDPDLRSRIIHEFHDAPLGGHLVCEKTFAVVSRDFYWPHMYKWVRKWVRSCEICQRVKPLHRRRLPCVHFQPPPRPGARCQWTLSSGSHPMRKDARGSLCSSIASAKWSI
ncbi:hypothetical protein PC116_g5544 [Phytophthora cactorum]|nr:hypothetical protein Pcac1_g24730 [Phytophthora cactorum]KAG4246665.1 hypothetical protein PC116_g5544 [Phytophthora cactorum]